MYTSYPNMESSNWVEFQLRLLIYFEKAWIHFPAFCAIRYLDVSSLALVCKHTCWVQSSQQILQAHRCTHHVTTSPFPKTLWQQIQCSLDLNEVISHNSISCGTGGKIIILLSCKNHYSLNKDTGHFPPKYYIKHIESVYCTILQIYLL